MAWVPLDKTFLVQFVTKLAELQSNLLRLKLTRKLERSRHIMHMMKQRARPDDGQRQNTSGSQDQGK